PAPPLFPYTTLFRSEPKRPRADDLLDLLGIGGRGHAGRHDKGHVARGLAERLEHEGERLVELEREGLPVDGGELRGVGQEQLAERVPPAPALDRLDRVLGHDRLAVVPAEAVAQRERPPEAPGGVAPGLHHLRLDPELLVGAEERVVDQVAVVARDVGGRPDGVEDLQIRLGDEADRATALLGVDSRRVHGEGRGGGGGAGEELTATQLAHVRISSPSGSGPSTTWGSKTEGIVARAPPGGSARCRNARIPCRLPPRSREPS